MSILTARNLGLSFGAFDLFQGVTLSIANDSKIGLIGPNGIGKTSLLLMLTGINAPTRGEISLARGRRLGYLPQEAMDAFADRQHTVYVEMQTVFADLLQQQAHLQELEQLMAENGADERLLQNYGDLQQRFEQAGGYEYELRIQQTLQGLGLGKDCWNMPLSHLSGGQKTRALLARLLLEKPDLLILDEPTNHLDVDAVEWLEHVLEDWKGAVLIVSHDRYFLDHTVNTIWEMTPYGLEEYSGNYSAYVQQREERWALQQRMFEEEKTRLLNEVDYIQRNWVRDSTHAQALGRLRRVSRELRAIEQYGVLAMRSGRKWIEMDIRSERPMDVIEVVRRVNALQLPSHRPLHIRPRLQANAAGGAIALRTSGVTVGYPGKVLFESGPLELRRGECVALMGPNGSGKTSFLKTLVGQIEPLAGEIETGPSFRVGYFAQAQDALNDQHTVLQELQLHKQMDDEPARAHLAQYLFRGEDVFKQVGMLSGGERARLALAILALEGANFLVLDEPTNHLDIPAREALQDVLDAFPGTILLVSHDRYLVDQLATQIWELREGRLRVFHGRYREFVVRQSVGRAQVLTQTTRQPLRGNDKEARRRSQALSLIEERIHAQEQALQRLYVDVQKASERGNFEQARTLGLQLAKVQADLDQLMQEWESLAA